MKVDIELNLNDYETITKVANCFSLSIMDFCILILKKEIKFIREFKQKEDIIRYYNESAFQIGLPYNL